MTSYHTRWKRPEEPADDPERLAIREALAFGKALFDVRTTLGLSVAELAMRASLTEDDIECIEERGTEPTIPCCAASPPPSTPASTSPPATTSAPSGSKPTLPERSHLWPTCALQALEPPIGALWNAGRLAAAHNWAICEGSAMVCEWLAGDRRTRRWRLRSVPSRRSPFMIADRDPRSPVAQVPVLRHRGMGQPERS